MKILFIHEGRAVLILIFMFHISRYFVSETNVNIWELLILLSGLEKSSLIKSWNTFKAPQGKIQQCTKANFIKGIETIKYWENIQYN